MLSSVPTITVTVIENNENREICSECNGECCKRHPCLLFPQDLKEVTIEKVTELLKGNYCLNYWEADEPVYFIQPKIKGDTRVVQDIWYGECIFFEDNLGCKLPFEDRPFSGKALIPDKEECIVPKGCGKESCKNAWIPYQSILLDAVRLLDTESDLC